MKKICALLLTVLLVLPVLVSCAEQTTNVKTTEQKQTEAPEVSEPSPSPTKVTPPTTKEVLEGKTACFLGDSLCAASTYDRENPRWGWATRIHVNYGLESIVNKGRDGASISDCRGENTIINQFLQIKNQKFDYLVLQGGVNDAWDSCAVGTITPEGTETFDLTTYAGGLENLFSEAKKCFPDTVICYVFNYRIASNIGRMSDMSEYLAEAKKICEKWGIPMLNLYEDVAFNKEFNIRRLTNSPDKIHPNSKGYDLLAPKIADFMAEVTTKK